MKKILFVLAVVGITFTNLIGCSNKNNQELEKQKNEEVKMEENKMSSIKYLGHGSLKLYLSNGKICYIDPYAGDDYDEKADLILVTHQHSDHNQIDMVAKNEGCEVYQNFDFLVDGEYKEMDLCGMHVKAVEAYNKNHPKDQCVGFVLNIDGKVVYVAGDTSTTEQMKEMPAYNIDYAFLPMDGKFNMDIEEGIECEKLIKAKWTIPYHIKPGELFDEERAKLFKTDTTMILKPGEVLEIK